MTIKQAYEAARNENVLRLALAIKLVWRTNKGVRK